MGSVQIAYCFVQGDGSPKDKSLFWRGTDCRCRSYEFYAWCTGWTEVHRCFVLGIAFAGGHNSVNGMEIPVWLMLLCSIVMGVGTSVGGEKIIKSVGMNMVKLERYQGFSADLAGAICLLYSSLMGVPVSTTHTKTSAIMGVGAVKRLSAINFSVVKDMMLTWIFTFPGCGLISFCMAKIFMYMFG